MIFGWALWQISDIKFVAQHHAIYQSEYGEYLDVTPSNNGVKEVLFFVDNRAPFDYVNLKFPVNFEYKHNIEKVWFTGKYVDEDFFIGKLSGSDYVENLFKKWRNDGIKLS